MDVRKVSSRLPVRIGNPQSAAYFMYVIYGRIKNRKEIPDITFLFNTKPLSSARFIPTEANL